jgi:putative OmpL-like beta-barrel porin-2
MCLPHFCWSVKGLAADLGHPRRLVEGLHRTSQGQTIDEASCAHRRVNRRRHGPDAAEAGPRRHVKRGVVWENSMKTFLARNLRHAVSCSAIFTWLSAFPVSAQEAPPSPTPTPIPEASEAPAWWKEITLNGFVSVGYVYNFEKPSSRVNALRVFDFDDNSIKVDVAELVVQRTVAKPRDFGFRMDLEAGASIPRISAASGLFRDAAGKAEDFDLQQAFVSYVAPLGDGLRVDIGKFNSPLGYEVIEGYDGYNDNYSRSFLFGYAVPFTHTGLRVSYPISSKVSAMAMVVNGWDNVKDNNREKTFHVQLAMTPVEPLTLTANFIAGAERAGSSDVRAVLDLIGAYKLTSRITLGANFDYGTEKGAGIDGADATWKGVAGYLRLGVSGKLALVARAETFDDEGGTRTGTDQTLTELTLTPELHLTEKLVLRADLRFDHSDAKVFDDHGTPSSNQTTLGLNGLIWF